MTTSNTPAPAAPAVETRTIGGLRVHAITAGLQRLDGGAMFGVVPKPLWERRIAPDARNRIPLAMRCLLLEHESGLVLIDTGAGSKENEKFHDTYGVENRGAEQGDTWLEDGLRTLGVEPGDIALVLNTHLHFDHAGGNTRRDADGTVRASFPNARYVVQGGEYQYATHTNERTAASYFPHNFVPLYESGQLELVTGEVEIAGGIRLVPAPGHTPHHQGILVDGGGEVAFYPADLVPTAAHLPLPWIMGYDVEPLVTLETKRDLLARAVADDWLFVFEHDAEVPWGRVARDGKGYGLRG